MGFLDMFRRAPRIASRDDLVEFLDRQAAARNAKKGILEKFKTKPAPDDPEVLKRQAERQELAAQRRTVLRGKVENGLKQLEAQEVKIQDAEAKAQEQLAEVAANRELLKVQKLTDELQDRLVSMRGALQATVETASESGSLVTLNELEAESAAAVSDEDFQKVMSK